MSHPVASTITPRLLLQKRLLLRLLTSVSLVFLLMLGGCGEGEEKEAAVEEEQKPSKPPVVQEKGAMDIFVDGVAMQIHFDHGRYLPAEDEESPDRLTLRGPGLYLVGEFDVNGDGAATVDDRFNSGWPLPNSAFLSKIILLQPYSNTADEAVEAEAAGAEVAEAEAATAAVQSGFVNLGRDGFYAVKSGQIETQEFTIGNELAGEGTTWAGTVKMILLSESGEEIEVYGRAYGTLKKGELSRQEERRLLNRAEVDAAALAEEATAQ